MRFWKRNTQINEKKSVSEFPIDVGINRKLIDLHIMVFIEDGTIYTKREFQVKKPVRSVDLACLITELEQLKILLVTDYTKGSLIANIGLKK